MEAVRLAHEEGIWATPEVYATTEIPLPGSQTVHDGQQQYLSSVLGDTPSLAPGGMRPDPGTNKARVLPATVASGSRGSGARAAPGGLSVTVLSDDPDVSLTAAPGVKASVQPACALGKMGCGPGAVAASDGSVLFTDGSGGGAGVGRTTVKLQAPSGSNYVIKGRRANGETFVVSTRDGARSARLRGQELMGVAALLLLTAMLLLPVWSAIWLVWRRYLRRAAMLKRPTKRIKQAVLSAQGALAVAGYGRAAPGTPERSQNVGAFVAAPSEAARQAPAVVSPASGSAGTAGNVVRRVRQVASPPYSAVNSVTGGADGGSGGGGDKRRRHVHPAASAPVRNAGKAARQLPVSSGGQHTSSKCEQAGCAALAKPDDGAPAVAPKPSAGSPHEQSRQAQHQKQLAAAASSTAAARQLSPASEHQQRRHRFMVPAIELPSSNRITPLPPSPLLSAADATTQGGSAASDPCTWPLSEDGYHEGGLIKALLAKAKTPSQMPHPPAAGASPTPAATAPQRQPQPQQPQAAAQSHNATETHPQLQSTAKLQFPAHPASTSPSSNARRAPSRASSSGSPAGGAPTTQISLGLGRRPSGSSDDVTPTKKSLGAAAAAGPPLRAAAAPTASKAPPSTAELACKAAAARPAPLPGTAAPAAAAAAPPVAPATPTATAPPVAPMEPSNAPKPSWAALLLKDNTKSEAAPCQTAAAAARAGATKHMQGQAAAGGERGMEAGAAGQAGAVKASEANASRQEPAPLAVKRAACAADTGVPESAEDETAAQAPREAAAAGAAAHLKDPISHEAAARPKGEADARDTAVLRDQRPTGASAAAPPPSAAAEILGAAAPGPLLSPGARAAALVPAVAEPPLPPLPVGLLLRSPSAGAGASARVGVGGEQLPGSCALTSSSSAPVGEVPDRRVSLDVSMRSLSESTSCPSPREDPGPAVDVASDGQQVHDDLVSSSDGSGGSSMAIKEQHGSPSVAAGAEAAAEVAQAQSQQRLLMLLMQGKQQKQARQQDVQAQVQQHAQPPQAQAQQPQQAPQQQAQQLQVQRPRQHAQQHQAQVQAQQPHAQQQQARQQAQQLHAQLLHAQQQQVQKARAQEQQQAQGQKLEVQSQQQQGHQQQAELPKSQAPVQQLQLPAQQLAHHLVHVQQQVQLHIPGQSRPLLVQVPATHQMQVQQMPLTQHMQVQQRMPVTQQVQVQQVQVQQQVQLQQQAPIAVSHPVLLQVPVQVQQPLSVALTMPDAPYKGMQDPVILQLPPGTLQQQQLTQQEALQQLQLHVLQQQQQLQLQQQQAQQETVMLFPNAAAVAVLTPTKQQRQVAPPADRQDPLMQQLRSQQAREQLKQMHQAVLAQHQQQQAAQQQAQQVAQQQPQVVYISGNPGAAGISSGNWATVMPQQQQIVVLQQPVQLQQQQQQSAQIQMQVQRQQLQPQPVQLQQQPASPLQSPSAITPVNLPAIQLGPQVQTRAPAPSQALQVQLLAQQLQPAPATHLANARPQPYAGPVDLAAGIIGPLEMMSDGGIAVPCDMQQQQQHQGLLIGGAWAAPAASEGLSVQQPVQQQAQQQAVAAPGGQQVGVPVLNLTALANELAIREESARLRGVVGGELRGGGTTGIHAGGAVGTPKSGSASAMNGVSEQLQLQLGLGLAGGVAAAALAESRGARSGGGQPLPVRSISESKRMEEELEELLCMVGGAAACRILEWGNSLCAVTNSTPSGIAAARCNFISLHGECTLVWSRCGERAWPCACMHVPHSYCPRLCLAPSATTPWHPHTLT